ncbi:hypothetical protein [Mesorhizobium sp. NZP2077]|uniref:hypothetical protein n=1 Tax=Mesorhizobium sp. NZP2077 TaxID=2483404 RepID=UPI001FF0681D|nr:hypothetical protein [Mesorhizobium sp. NZP2077]
MIRNGHTQVPSCLHSCGNGPRRRDAAPRPVQQLRALIEAHKKAYAAFGEAVRQMGGSSCNGASREEEQALLAICAYPAVSEGDCLAKARYLLEIEARGELDLVGHMRALLHSTMWKG